MTLNIPFKIFKVDLMVKVVDHPASLMVLFIRPLTFSMQTVITLPPLSTRKIKTLSHRLLIH